MTEKFVPLVIGAIVLAIVLTIAIVASRSAWGDHTVTNEYFIFCDAEPVKVIRTGYTETIMVFCDN